MKRRTHLKTADDREAARYFKTSNNREAAGKTRNIVRLRKRQPTATNVDRPEHSVAQPSVAQQETKPEQTQGGSPPPEDTIATDEAQ